MTLPTRSEIEKEESDKARVEMHVVSVGSLPQFSATTRVKVRFGNDEERLIKAPIYEMNDPMYCQYLPHKIINANGAGLQLFYYMNPAKPKFQLGTVFYIFTIGQVAGDVISYDGRCDVFIDQVIGYNQTLYNVFLVGEKAARQLIDFQSVDDQVIDKALSPQTRFYMTDTTWDGVL